MVQSTLERRLERFYRHDYRISTILDAKRLSKVAEIINQSKPGSVLDVGCGNCALLEKVDSKCKTGVDLFNFGVSLSNFHLAIADAQYLPFRDDVLDLVSACEVLEHIPEMRLALSEIRRVVRSVGKTVVTVPNDPLIHLLGKIVRLIRFMPKKEYEIPANDREYHKHHIHFQRGNLRKAVSKTLGKAVYERGMSILPVFLPLPYSFSLFYLMVFKPGPNVWVSSLN